MVNAMLYGTLSLSAIVIGAISFAIAGRSRGLWLSAGRSRLQLHAWCERLMLRVALAIALPLALLGGCCGFPAAARVAWTLPAARNVGAGDRRRVVRLHAAASAHLLDALGALLLVVGYLQPLVVEAEECFHRALKFEEFDVAELSLSSHMVTVARGENAYVGVPAFLLRVFRQSAIYIRTDRNINVPQDLRGKIVGVPEYQMTANV